MSEALEKLIRQAEAQKLQLELNLQFTKNIKLFQERFPSIHKILAEYTPKNTILQLDPSGNLNLVDIEKREYLYNIAPMEYCERQLQIFEKENKVRKFRIAKCDEYNSRHLHIPYVNKLLEKYSQKPVSRLKRTPSLLTNVILSGVGIGYQIPLLLARFDIHNIFIYENSIDCFYASLQTINWQPILDYFRASHRSITFCIGVKPEKALAQVEHLVNNRGLHSQMFSFIYRHSLREEELDFVEAYTKEVRTYLFGLGYYDDEQIGLAHAYHNLKSDCAVFLSDATYQRKSRLLIIGNGPSLDFHKDYIERNRDTAIVMTCGTALGSLLRMGIKPDFHVEMERTVSMNDFLKFGTTEEMRSGITLLCLHTVSPITIGAFEDACFAIKTNDAGSDLVHNYFLPKKLQELPFCNPTVTNCGLAFAVYMGFKDVHLIGIDLGIPSENQHHSKYSLHYDMEKHVGDKAPFNYNYQDNKDIYREGNFGGQVKTHHVLDSSRLSFERLLELVIKAIPDFRCINSNNGVKIKYTTTCRLEEIEDCSNKNKMKEISAIKANHFFRMKNDKFDSLPASHLLSYFYNQRKGLKLSDNIENDFDLMVEMNRIYDIINKKNDKITHHLLRGSINSFFGAIIENGLYCEKTEDFKYKLNTGRNLYNEFIDEVYQQMETDPFRLDDTENPILSDMRKNQTTANTN